MCRYYRAVLRVLLNFCHRPAIRFGLAHDPSSSFRNPRFASFFADVNRHRFDPNRSDTILRGRRLVRQAIFALLGAGAIWVMVESAHALTLF
jgi:hypothetical protein